MIRLRTSFILFILLSAMTASGCRKFIRIPIVSRMPVNFMATMQGGKRIGIISNDAKMNQANSWDTIIKSVAEKKINEFRYFTVVDITNRETRLKEIVFSQTGVTSNTLEVGNELAVDGLLLLDVPRDPVSNCITTKRKEKKEGRCLRYKNTGETNRTCISYNSRNQCTGYRNEPVKTCAEYEYYYIDVYESKRTTIVFLKGELMNVETGAKLSYTNTEPYEDTVDKNQCSSELDSYHKAAELAGENVINNLSPRVTDLKVPVETNPAGSPPEKAKVVKGYLKLGVDSVKSNPPDYEDASRQWHKALTASVNQSIYSMWNLGIYYWYAGDTDRAEKYFSDASEQGGPDFLKEGKKFGMFGKRRKDIISVFRNEKERIAVESRKN